MGREFRAALLGSEPAAHCAYTRDHGRHVCLQYGDKGWYRHRLLRYSRKKKGLPLYEYLGGEGEQHAGLVGSRGIANIPMIIKAIVGSRPFIVPAMGRHGGASREGQLEVIQSFSITEQSMGCPIRSSMETVPIGRTSQGHEVRMDKNTAGAGGIIVVGRVKPHTAFRGPYESGLMKIRHSPWQATGRRALSRGGFRGHGKAHTDVRQCDP